MASALRSFDGVKRFEGETFSCDFYNVRVLESLARRRKKKCRLGPLKFEPKGRKRCQTPFCGILVVFCGFVVFGGILCLSRKLIDCIMWGSKNPLNSFWGVFSFLKKKPHSHPHVNNCLPITMSNANNPENHLPQVCEEIVHTASFPAKARCPTSSG